MFPQYIRISVTARCNLRCFYCRPPDALPDAAPQDEFEPEAFGLLAQSAAREGARKIRLTGGEPLLREDLEEIVARVAEARGVEEITLTTNAIGLERRAQALRKAGLGRVNISLDTLDRERFTAIAGQDRLGDVLSGIEGAAALFDQVKLNTVPLRGVNGDEIESLVRFAGAKGLWIRFIERYSSPGAEGDANGFIRGQEVKARLERAFGRLEVLESDPLSIEESYRIPAADGARVGLIASSTHPPCGACAKLRFTSSGELRGCLYSPSGVDLGSALRRSDGEAVRLALRQVFAAKERQGPGAHPTVSQPINLVGG